MAATLRNPSTIQSPHSCSRGRASWRIVSGAVDIFLVDIEREQAARPAPPRHALEGGGFCMRLRGLRRRRRFAGLPAAGCTLGEMARRADVPPDAVEKWTSALVQAMVNPPPDLPDHPGLRVWTHFIAIALAALVRDRAEADRKERDRLTLAAGQETARRGHCFPSIGLSPGAAGTRRDGEEMGLLSPLLQARQRSARTLGIRILAPRGTRPARRASKPSPERQAFARAA